MLVAGESASAAPVAYDSLKETIVGMGGFSVLELSVNLQKH
jgi:hypothetical protein